MFRFFYTVYMFVLLLLHFFSSIRKNNCNRKWLVFVNDYTLSAARKKKFLPFNISTTHSYLEISSTLKIEIIIHLNDNIQRRRHLDNEGSISIYCCSCRYRCQSIKSQVLPFPTKNLHLVSSQQKQH